MDRTRPPRRPRGYALLVVAVVSAAMLLMVLASISLGGSEAEQVRLESQDALALSLAERGLERTKAYLARLAMDEVDFDRALDPSLDDTCAIGPPFVVTDPSNDDHLPPFTDPGAAAVTASGWGGSKKSRFRSVPWPSAAAPQGAYLVRIDDDDDDQGWALPRAEADNPFGTTCREGTALTGLSAYGSNPVRDRDRTVVITSIGVTPGTDPSTAQVRKVLRAVVGLREMAGIVAGGPVDVSGSAELCGAYANTEATGEVDVRKMCASSCNAACLAAGALTARTSDPTCTRADGGPCNASVDPPPVIPFVSADAPQWRPPNCTVAPCTPYYLVTTQGAAGLKVKMWDYGACPSPRSAVMSFASPCWHDVSAATTDGTWIYLDDGDPGLVATFPSPSNAPTVHLGVADYRVFKLDSGGAGTINCPVGTTAPVSNAVYKYDPTPIDMPAPIPDHLPLLPHGVWLIDGRLVLEASADMQACPAGWLGATLVVRASVVLHNQSYSLKPPAGLEAVLVTGGDLEFQTGLTHLDDCSSGAAVVVREQAKAQGTNELFAPLLVRNDPTCFSEVASTTAIDFGGNMTVKVDSMPLLSIAPLTSFSWSESAH